MNTTHAQMTKTAYRQREDSEYNTHTQMTKTAYRQTEDSEYNTRPDNKDSLQTDRGQ